MELSLNDLNHITLYIKLNKEFQTSLFEKIRKKFKNWDEVCKFLGISDFNLRRFRNGSFIPFNFVKKVIADNYASFEEIERNVEIIRYGHIGVQFNIKFPIKLTEKHAALLAHSLGDGTVTSKNRYFEYTNTQIELIKKVENLVKEVFGKIKYRYREEKRNKKTIFRLTYPNVIGELLLSIGSVSGRKVETSYRVPKWIINGTKEIKKSFLQSLFDDEGYVDKQGKITLTYGKRNELINNLKDFLKDIENLLKEFGIYNIGYKTKTHTNPKTTALDLYITNLGQLNIFRNNINFCHNERKKRLEILLKTQKKFKYTKKGFEVKQIILSALEDRAMTTEELSFLIKRVLSRTRRWLYKFEKEGLIERVFSQKHGVRTIWKIKNSQPQKFPIADPVNTIPFLIKNNGKPMNIQEIASKYGYSYTTTSIYLKDLERRRLIKKLGRNRHGILWTSA